MCSRRWSLVPNPRERESTSCRGSRPTGGTSKASSQHPSRLEAKGLRREVYTRPNLAQHPRAGRFRSSNFPFPDSRWAHLPETLAAKGIKSPECALAVRILPTSTNHSRNGYLQQRAICRVRGQAYQPENPTIGLGTTLPKP